MTTERDTELAAARRAMYGLISERVVANAPGDWMAFEAAVNDAFDRLDAARASSEGGRRVERESLAYQIEVVHRKAGFGGGHGLAANWTVCAHALCESARPFATPAAETEEPSDG